MCIKASHSSANNPANPHIPEDAINHAFCDSRVAPIYTHLDNTFENIYENLCMMLFFSCTRFYF